MSASGKTTNYELGIYIGTDVTDWLGTFNGNMNKIDAQMKENANSATTASESAGQALSKSTSNETEIEEINSTLGTLQSTVTSQGQQLSTTTTLAQTAKTTADTANGKADQNADSIAKIAFGTLQNVTGLNSKITPNESRPPQATYSQGLSILFLTGTFTVTDAMATNDVIGTLPSSIPRPSELRTLNVGFWCYPALTSPNTNVAALRLSPDGKLYFNQPVPAGTTCMLQNMYIMDNWD